MSGAPPAPPPAPPPAAPCDQLTKTGLGWEGTDLGESRIRLRIAVLCDNPFGNPNCIWRKMAAYG